MTVMVRAGLSAKNSKRRSGVIFFSAELDEKVVEIGVAACPLGAQVLEPAFRRNEVLALKAARPDPPPLVGADQAGPLKNGDVLDEGRQGHVERLSQLADRSGAPAQTLEHRPPR